MLVRKLPRLVESSKGQRTEYWGNPGLPFAMVQCLHQSKDYIKRKLGLWKAQKCIPLFGAISSLTCAGQQTTPSHVRQCRAENEILGKSGAAFRLGAVFALKQLLYQKEAKAMESPRLYSSHRCNKRTYVC